MQLGNDPSLYEREGTPRAGAALHAVLPGDVDDPAMVSGGNVYDRRVLDGLRDLGHDVVEHALPGAWPRPDGAARDRLDTALAAVPDGTPVLLDGLVAGGVPDVVARHAGRLPVAVLVHLPLGEEPATADLAAGEGRVLRAAASVIATSAWAARRLAARDGLDCHVAPPGADPAPTATGTDGVRRVVCVGALTPAKGQDLLVDALPDGLECDLVGPRERDPDFAADLERRAAGRRAIRIRGPLPRDEAYDAADLLVVPSRIETYGMVVTEALARGIPVVAADVGGLAETLGGAGTLIPAEDVAALAAMLLRWRDEPDLRLGLRSSARSSQCTLQAWTQTSRRLAAALPTPRTRSVRRPPSGPRA